MILGDAELGSAVLGAGGSIVTPNLSSAFNFGQTVVSKKEINLSVSSSLGLGDSGAIDHEILLSSLSMLSIGQTVNINQGVYELSNYFNMVQSMQDNTIDAPVSTNLIFDQVVGYQFSVIPIGVSNALNFGQNVIHNSIDISVSNNFNFNQIIANTPYLLTADNNFNLGQVTTHNVKFVSAENIFALDQVIIASQPNLISVSDLFTFSQVVRSNVALFSPSNQLDFSQSVAFQIPLSFDINQTFNLGQSVTIRQAIVNISVGNILSYGQSAAKSKELFAVSNVVVDQSVKLTFDRTVVQPFNIWQSFSYDLTRLLINEYPFGQSIVINRESTYVLSQPFTFNQSVLVFTSDLECVYAPVRNPDSLVSAVPPTFTYVNNVRFYWPYSAPTEEVLFRTPKAGNTENLQQVRFFDESRGGEVLNFQRPDAPEQQRLVLNFEELTQSQVNDMLDFIDASLGQEIGYRDYESRTWKGIITNPEAEFTQVGPNCRFTANIEFVGELVA